MHKGEPVVERARSAMLEGRGFVIPLGDLSGKLKRLAVLQISSIQDFRSASLRA
jgi:hypothetical protein